MSGHGQGSLFFVPEERDFDEGRAVARATDPGTSWEAAESIDGLTERRRAVLDCLRLLGPMTDTALISAYSRHEDLKDWPPQSVSGLRTRRKELVDRKLVFDSGEKEVLPTGRRAIVWTTQQPRNGR